MHARVQVLGKASFGCPDNKVQCAHHIQAPLGAETTPTVDAVGMTLAVVLVQTMRALEELVTYVAVVVYVETVRDKIVIVVKVGLTFATIVMSGTLDVMLFETQRRAKVLITVVTDVVAGRVFDVLLVRGPGLEVAAAAIAVLHQSSTGVTRRHGPSSCQ